MKIIGRKEEIKHILRLLYKDEMEQGCDPQDSLWLEDSNEWMSEDEYCDYWAKVHLNEINCYYTDFGSERPISMEKFIDSLGTDHEWEFKIEWKTRLTKDIIDLSNELISCSDEICFEVKDCYKYLILKNKNDKMYGIYEYHLTVNGNYFSLLEGNIISPVEAKEKVEYMLEIEMED